MDLKIKSIGKLIFNNLTTIIIFQFSLRVLEKRLIHTDSLLSKVFLICLKREELKSFLSFLNWLFQSKLLWTQETLKLLPLLLRFCKPWSHALIPLVRLLFHITDRFSQSWICSRLKIWIWVIRLITVKEKETILEISSNKLWNFSKCTAEKMLSLISSTWYQLMNHAFSIEQTGFVLYYAQ